MQLWKLIQKDGSQGKYCLFLYLIDLLVATSRAEINWSPSYINGLSQGYFRRKFCSRWASWGGFYEMWLHLAGTNLKGSGPECRSEQTIVSSVCNWISRGRECRSATNSPSAGILPSAEISLFAGISPFVRISVFVGISPFPGISLWEYHSLWEYLILWEYLPLWEFFFSWWYLCENITLCKENTVRRITTLCEHINLCGHIFFCGNVSLCG